MAATVQQSAMGTGTALKFALRLGRVIQANVLREVLTPQPGFLVKNTILKGDNSSANLFSSASSGTRNVRHLSLTQFYVRSLSTKGKILIRGIPSAENSSDLLTKVLDEPNLIRLLSYIGCISA